MAIQRHPPGKKMMDAHFLRDVDEGLSKSPKALPSRYFYDAHGDELFVQIMKSPEYYLTNAEHEILREQTADIAAHFQANDEPFFLVELGAGDGTKTLELLRYLSGRNFSYMPIDISASALAKLKTRIQHALPEVDVQPQQGEYFSILSKLHDIHQKMVILFLGSNLGNMLDDRAHRFMQQLAESMNTGDILLLGLDLKKDPNLILPAYNDARGITSQFNLNLLARINRELDGHFSLEKFVHHPTYDEENGIARSYLKCLEEHTVYIGALEKRFHFTEGELIHTEISRKYDDDIVAHIVADTQLEIRQKFVDSRHFFADYLFEKTAY
jgi:L-histidine N-alpha-methyltransferase